MWTARPSGYPTSDGHLGRDTVPYGKSVPLGSTPAPLQIDTTALPAGPESTGADPESGHAGPETGNSAPEA